MTRQYLKESLRTDVNFAASGAEGSRASQTKDSSSPVTSLQTSCPTQMQREEEEQVSLSSPNTLSAFSYSQLLQSDVIPVSLVTLAGFLLH